MKKIFAIAVVFSVLSIAAKIEGNKQLSEVNQVQGLHLFIDSKPVAEYEYLGTIKVTAWNVSSEQYQGVRDALIKKAKKEYPEGNGLIFNFNAGGADLADVIKFKE
jgi:hypothetical protein